MAKADKPDDMEVDPNAAVPVAAAVANDEWEQMKAEAQHDQAVVQGVIAWHLASPRIS